MKKNQTSQQSNLDTLTSLEWLEEDKITPTDVDVSFLSWLDIDNDTLEKLDTGTKKKIKKKKFILIFVLSVFVAFTMLFVGYRVKVYEKTVQMYEQEDKPVLMWLRAFVNGDFVTCDTISRDAEVKLTTTQSKYYEKMLDKASRGITNVEVKKIVDNKDKICYTIEVEYKQYKSSIDVQSYQEKYNEIKELYFDDKIEDDEVTEKIRVLYLNTYEQGFKLGNKKGTFEFTIYSDDKGVGNTNTFIKELVEKTKVLSVSNEIKEQLSTVEKELPEE